MKSDPVGRMVAQFERAIQAAAGPSYSTPEGSHKSFELTRTQLEIETHCDEVGWLGYYRDVIADLGSKCRIHPRILNPESRVWEDATDDPLIGDLWRQFWRPSPDMTDGVHHLSEQDWLHKDLGLLIAPGEFAYWPTENAETGELAGWVTAHPDQLTTTQDQSRFAYRTRPDATRGSVSWFEYDAEILRRAWKPDRKWTGMATTPLARILPLVRLYRAVVANLNHAANSRLLMNGLLWVPTTEDDVLSSPSEGEGFDQPSASSLFGDASTPDDGGLGKLLESFAKQAAKAWRDRDTTDVAKVVPFPFTHHTKPEMIEIGNPVDKATLAVLPELIEQAALGLDLPKDALTSGAGESNHWNSAEKRRAMNTQGVFPKVESYCGQWVAEFRQYLERVDVSIDPSTVDVWYDPSEIVIKEDNVAQFLAAHAEVNFKREVVAEKVGHTAEDLADEDSTPDPPEADPLPTSPDEVEEPEEDENISMKADRATASGALALLEGC